jgi:hypothetical protein
MALLGWKGERPEVEWVPGRVELMKRTVLGRAAAFDAAALLS